MKGLSGFKQALKYLLCKSVVPIALAKGRLWLFDPIVTITAHE
jgi:hypothetical protein